MGSMLIRNLEDKGPDGKTYLDADRGYNSREHMNELLKESMLRLSTGHTIYMTGYTEHVEGNRMSIYIDRDTVMVTSEDIRLCVSSSEVYRDYKKISWNGRLSTITVFTEDRLIKRLELKYE